MSAERVVYSIQKTYIIKPVFKSDIPIFTCDERIDIPTIEPVTHLQAVGYDVPLTVVPCVELKMLNLPLDAVNLVFETNEGVTVLPIDIGPGVNTPLENPYKYPRSVLVLPRGATGVKTCKITEKDSRLEFQHNFTFGIMPPPYNYDNALFGYLSYEVQTNSESILGVYNTVKKAFGKLQEGLYELQVEDSRFPTTSTPIPEKRNLSMIKFRVTNNTGAKASLELEFIYRKVDNSKGKDIFALPIAEGDNSVEIDIDKGTITTISDSTAEPFMFSFPPKYDGHVITALNKASITGDTELRTINYNYYLKPSLM